MRRPPLTRHGLAFMMLCVWLCLALGALAAAHHPHSQNPPASAQINRAPREQASPSSPSSPISGTITGRIVTDDGQPVPHVPVFAMPTGTTNIRAQTTNTDEQGRFQFTDLMAAPYFINSTVPGYIASHLIEGNGSRSVFYHLGETVTLTMVKGGVITGRVTDASGTPIIALAVRVWRVRDADGKLVRPSSFGDDRQTDDRGIYRIFGLAPGSYLVGTTNRPSRSSGLPPRIGQAPTYHPTSTSDTAVEVIVRSGEEASGIDIRFRGDHCYAVSGTVVEAMTSSSASPESTLSKVQVSLYNLATHATEAGATIEPNNGKYAFALYGVPDGEYEMAAKGTTSNEDEVVTLPRRVSIKGADVTGIELTIMALGSISGRIALESGEARPNCETKRSPRLEEALLKTRPAEKEIRHELISSWYSFTAASAPNNQGEFTLRNLTPGRHRLETNLPSENWYIKSITTPESTAARRMIDVGRNGFALKAGEKAKGLTITMADGAASLRGQIKPATEGARWPASLRMHLVPAEREQADNVLRYAEAAARQDGQFAFGHLAPGRYWIIARVAAESETAEAPPPAAWDNAERGKLRREAESSKVEIELQPCQRVGNYVLRYAPSK